MNRLRPAIWGVLVLVCAIGTSAEETFKKEEFAGRRARLFDQISDGIAVFFGAEENGPSPVKFRQAPDFFYLTGIDVPGAVLVMNGQTRETVVFANKRSPDQIAFVGPGLLEIGDAQQRYGLDRLVPLEQVNAFLSAQAAGARHLYLPLSLDDNLQQSRGEVRQADIQMMDHPLYRALSPMRQAMDHIRSLAPQLPVADLGPMMARLRSVKTPYEIERMRRAGAIGAASVKEAIKGTRPGEYEYEIQAAAHFVTTSAGAGLAFTPIAASGPNTMAFHYEANNRRMLAGDVVLLDYGADYDYYTSDITRTWPVSGRFTPEQEQMYRCVLEASKAIIAMMRPGVTITQMRDAGLTIYRRHGFEKEYEEGGRYVGHYVGMSVHDVNPGADVPLQAGATFNVEPMLTLKDRKIHMRLEDSVLVTKNGSENLTRDVPVEIDEIYSLIEQKRIGQ